MKILFLTPQLPYPPHQGTTIRNYHLIRYLADRHTIDLLTFLAPGQTVKSTTALDPFCRRVAYLPQPVRPLRQRAMDTFRTLLPDMALRLESQAMHTLVCDWLQDGYDIVQIEGIEMAQYSHHVQTVFPPSGKRPLLVFDDHNCEYLLQKRNALTDLRHPKRWPAAFYSLIQWQKLRRYEQQICRHADVVLAVSPVDQQVLQRLAPDVTIALVANGIDSEERTPPVTHHPPPATSSLLFTGKMDYRPNIDAVLWFADEVLPHILREAPDVHFQVVGMNPHARLDRLRQQPAIEITGAVPSIDPYWQAATIYVVPLRVGGGTRFKVLDAMAHAKPIVTTTLGVEGIDVQDGRELLLADTAQTFAAAVLRLLHDAKTDGALGQQLGANAQRFVAAHYRWQQIIPSVEQVYRETIGSI